LKLSRDGWGGLAVLAASLVLFALTLDLKANPLVPIGPGFYPRIVLGLTAVLAAALAAFDFFRKRELHRGEKANYAAVVLHFAVFGIYIVALPWLGFRIATFAYVAATNALLDFPESTRGWARVGLLALLTAGLTHLVFERQLSVLLPRGRWTDF
jgi:hypothetical protein